MVDDGVISLTNDNGGIVAVVAAASHVRCSPEALVRLHLQINLITWSRDSARSTGIHYQRLPTGGHIAGGTGGGEVIPGTWVHRIYEELGIADEIRDVIEGRAERLATSFKWACAIVRYDTGEPYTSVGQVGVRRVTKAVWSEAEAKSEIARLSATAEEDSAYVLERVRVASPERGTDVETPEQREEAVHTAGGWPEDGPLQTITE
jgi:hypothetical protein